MLVREIMTKRPIALKQRDTLGTGVRLFSRHGISGCPVVDSKKRVIGIITQTDVLNAVDAHGKILKPGENLFSLVLGFSRGPLKKILKTPVKNHMRRDVAVVSDDDDIDNAIAIMNRRDVERLPVVRKGRLVGVISRKDIIRFLQK